jgi:hypothetical protein
MLSPRWPAFCLHEAPRGSPCARCWRMSEVEDYQFFQMGSCPCNNSWAARQGQSFAQNS